MVFPTVPEAHVASAASRLGYTVPKEEVGEYQSLLAALKTACEEVMGHPDSVPAVDHERFPRTNIHRPATADNKLSGWAYKATVKGAEGGLLAGRTVCLKDNILLAGVPCVFGTDAIKDYEPEIDATVVTRILEGGGVIVGKATCENMSHGGASFTSPGPPVQNPHAFGFSTAGSSSGCGALVGSGEVDMAMGGDQGGSIRLPATFCGLVGLKATFGLIPYTGVLSSAPSVDHTGPMARTVLDCATLLQVVAGADGIDDRQLGAPTLDRVEKYASDLLAARNTGVNGLKVGVLREGFGAAKEQPEVRALFDNVATLLRGEGVTVEEVTVPEHATIRPAMTVINKLESSQIRQGRLVGRRSLYVNEYYEKLLPWTQATYENVHNFVVSTALGGEFGWEHYPLVYGRAMNQVRAAKNAYDAALSKYDVLVMPTTSFVARRNPDEDNKPGPLGSAQLMAGIVFNTSQFNGTGHPAMTIPIGVGQPLEEDRRSDTDRDIRLPLGMQIVGKHFGEAMVLRVGDAVEQLLGDWKRHDGTAMI